MFFEAFVREAKVFDRGRKGEDECAGAGEGELGEEALENAGCDGESVADASEAVECDREDIGGIMFWRLWLEGFADSGDSGRVRSSEGISSAAGMGRPLPAATN